MNSLSDYFKQLSFLKEELEFEKQLNKLKKENNDWSIQFNELIKIRESANSLERSGQLIEGIEKHLEAIEFAENSAKLLNFNNLAFDINRVIILYGKTKQTEKLRIFLIKIINEFPDCSDIGDWKLRLSKTYGIVKTNSKEIDKSSIKVRNPNNPTKGKQIINFKKNMPEFNFYFDMPEGMETFEYLSFKKPVPFDQSVKLRKFRDEFETVLNEAKIAESTNSIDVAIEIYEYLISEEYEYTDPFERLMVIYKKLKWLKEEKSVYERAIHFFESVRSEQKRYVLEIAKKYRSETKALEYINSNKKIQYFGGAFDLYNPYPKIDNWKLKLEKLNQ